MRARAVRSLSVGVGERIEPTLESQVGWGWLTIRELAKAFPPPISAGGEQGHDEPLLPVPLDYLRRAFGG